MPESIISVSGLRGIVGESLTPEVVTRYIAAFAAETPPGPIVVSRDGRTTGAMIGDAVRATLMAAGRDVLDAGIVATPTNGILVRTLRAAGGIQISASHNPPPYNGLKLFNGEGRVIPAAAGQKVIENYRSQSPRWVSYDKLGVASNLSDTTTAHWELIRKVVNMERIQRAKFRVMLDANHGSGSILGRHLLHELGCEVMVLGGEPDGRFAHPPEPTAENLSEVTKMFSLHKPDVVFCQDPDADRLALIDDTGTYIGEEYTLALCVDHLLQHHPRPVVTNCSTSRMAQDLSKKYGVPFFHSAVGEANVVDAMLAHETTLGGEGNGGLIDLRIGYVRDSFAAMAILLDGLAERQTKLSTWVKQLPSYAIHKSKVALGPESVPAAVDALKKHFSDAVPDQLDGLRLDWPNKWLLVRASNTEPIVRIIAEAPTATEAQRLCEECVRTLER